jgi:regulator of replication initiation timing
LDAYSLNVNELETKLLEKPHVSVTSLPCEVCGTLKGNIFHAIKENTELKQEVAYLTSHLERTVVSEKMIEDDLNHVEESATKYIYKLSVGFEICEDKGEKSALKFVPRSNYHKEEETLKSTKTHYPSNPKPSFNPKREVWKETLKQRDEAFICMFCVCAGHLDEFCFRRKRIEKTRFDYARNSYHDKFIDFLPRTFSHASSHFFSWT